MSNELRICEALSGVVPVCVFGAGGHGQVVAMQIARRAPSVRLVFGDNEKQKSPVEGISVRFQRVGQVEGHLVLAAIGNNTARRSIQEAAQAAALDIGHLIVDFERYFTTPPGPGAQILAGAVVNPEAQIGAGVIVNTNAVVEHHCVVGDFCHLAPGSVVGGGAVLGNEVFLGTNATVLPEVKVAPGCLIGAGAVVACDLVKPGTYVGVPARPQTVTKRDVS